MPAAKQFAAGLGLFKGKFFETASKRFFINTAEALLKPLCP